jgi:hypothetical protein
MTIMGTFVDVNTGTVTTRALTPEEIAELPPPPSLEEQRSRMKLTFAQLLIGLVTEEWITEAEGTTWLQGTVPATVNALIQSLPVEQRFTALARAVRPSEVLRLDSLVIAMGSAEGKTATELDDFFRTYSVV